MSRPTGSPVITTRPMTVDDLPVVLELEDELFAPDVWSEGMYRDELADRRTRYYRIAESDGRVAGYAGAVLYADEAHVATIGVRTSLQGNGIGAKLLDELLAEADRRGIGRVLLEVRADHPVPQQLYRSRGFVEIGRRRNYYPLAGADAVVMARG